MAFKISIDKEKCIGCGSCASICPKGFEMKDGKSHPKKASVEEISCESEAESMCPASSIKIEKI